MTRLSLPHPASQRCLSAIWNRNSAIASDGWKNGGSPLTSLRALQCSLLAGASKNPDQCYSSGSLSYESMQSIIWEWSLIHGWLGRFTSTRLGKKAVQRLLGPLLHRRNGLSIQNGVLLYKQLIRPMMDYGERPDWAVWTFAARSHARKLQVI